MGPLVHPFTPTGHSKITQKWEVHTVTSGAPSSQVWGEGGVPGALGELCLPLGHAGPYAEADGWLARGSSGDLHPYTPWGSRLAPATAAAGFYYCFRKVMLAMKSGLRNTKTGEPQLSPHPLSQSHHGLPWSMQACRMYSF